MSNKNQLFNYIELNFDLDPIVGGWGRNLDAFWDCYSYSNEEKYIKIINYNEISDMIFKEYIDKFISLLKELKKTNPNFDYKIIS